MPTSSTPSQVEQFFNQYRLKKYPKGRVIILHGAVVEEVFYVVAGKVKMYDVSQSGDELILNVFKPGAFFPMASAINKQNNLYIYEAETEVELRQAPAGEVVTFIKQHPDIMFDLLGRVFTGMEGLLGRMSQLMSASAISRLIYELIIEARRFGVSDDGSQYQLSISEKDLAARAGLSRETVSRQIRKLKDQGFISVRNRTITINDLSLLENYTPPLT